MGSLTAMGLFGLTRVTCPAGQWTTIVSMWLVHMPWRFDVQLGSPAAGEPAGEIAGEIAGEFEETKSSWIFPGPSWPARSRDALPPRLLEHVLPRQNAPAADIVALVR